MLGAIWPMFIVFLLGFSLVTVVGGRLLTRRLSHALNTRSVTSQVTLIAGTNDEARALARTLQRRPWMGYRVCGFVEVSQSGLSSMDGLPVFGTVDDIAQISRLFVTMITSPQAKIEMQTKIRKIFCTTPPSTSCTIRATGAELAVAADIEFAA